MTKMKFIAITLAAVMALSACGTGGGGAAPAAEGGAAPAAEGGAAPAAEGNVTLTFWHSKTDPAVIALFQTWDERTNGAVTIDQTIFVDDDFKVQSRVALAAGNTPDVWWMNSGSSLVQFVEEGGLMSLEEFREEFGWDDVYDPTALNWTSVDGELFGLPWSQYTPWLIWANNDFFEEHGLDFPVTVDDYIALAPVLRELGQEPMVVYNLDGWYGALFFGEFVAQMMNANDWMNEINSGVRRWETDDIARRSLEYIERMAQANVFLTGFATMRQDTALPVWANQQSPLMYQGTWFAHVIGTEFDFSVQALPFPRIYPGSINHSFQNSIDWALGIAPGTNHLREALEFITFAAGYELHALEAATGLSLSPIPEVNYDIELPYFFLQDAIMDQAGIPTTVWFAYAFPMAVVAEFQMQVSLIMTGQTDIDSALAAIQRVHNDHY